MPGAKPFAVVRKIVSLFFLIVLVTTLVLILKNPPAPNVITSPAAAQSAERKLDAASQAASSGQPAQVRLDSTELNSYLAQNLQLAGSSPAAPAEGSARSNAADPVAAAPAVSGTDPQAIAQAESTVENVKVDLDGDLVRTYVIFNFHGKDMSLEIDGHLHTDGGYMKFDPVGGKFGSFPVPQSALQEAVRRMMDSPENRDKLRLPANISNIEVENSQAVISYR